MDENKHGKCGGCDHGFCGEGHGALRWVIGIILFALIFWVGMRVGEIKSEIYGGYGDYPTRGMMRYSGGYGQPMMYDYGMPVAPTTVVVPSR